jgi:hypothetical protein
MSHYQCIKLLTEKQLFLTFLIEKDKKIEVMRQSIPKFLKIRYCNQNATKEVIIELATSTFQSCEKSTEGESLLFLEVTKDWKQYNIRHALIDNEGNLIRGSQTAMPLSTGWGIFLNGSPIFMTNVNNGKFILD